MFSACEKYKIIKKKTTFTPKTNVSTIFFLQFVRIYSMLQTILPCRLENDENIRT